MPNLITFHSNDHLDTLYHDLAMLGKITIGVRSRVFVDSSVVCDDGGGSNAGGCGGGDSCDDYIITLKLV